MTVVVKIGTSSLTAETGDLRESAIAQLCAQVATVRARGQNVVIVTSVCAVLLVGAFVAGVWMKVSLRPGHEAMAALLGISRQDLVGQLRAGVTFDELRQAG